jgi:UDP-N-acetyl-D-glucosamine/UDP-N-acetyl-D-galactosamine dehydrogenase
MKNLKISIIGLGYVGLPLAIAFSKIFDVIGFDINPDRINNLKLGKDVFNDQNINDLKKVKKLQLTSSQKDILGADYYIVTVPTPVDKNNKPDLKSLINASKIVGKSIKKGATVVFESTVYPGCSEEICIPVLEKFSGYKLNKGFYCGYSPERINVGDKKHTLEKIVKVVSGSNKNATNRIYNLYKNIIKTKIFKASSIKVAEAAKVIENTQRDLNIALLNELSIIFDKLDINTNDVIEAASTKWNFVKYKPGLVGGHCVGVDPFYLTYKAKKAGYTPKVILAGRDINEKMSQFIVNKTIRLMKEKKINLKKPRLLILGFSFKENCSDPRNSKVEDIVKLFLRKNISIKIYDPIVYKSFLDKKYQNLFVNKISNYDNYFDAIILAVPHKIFLQNYKQTFKKILKRKNVIFDVKSVLKKDYSTTTL